MAISTSTPSISRQRGIINIVPIVAIALLIAFLPWVSCACGHFGVIAFPVTTVSAAMAWGTVVFGGRTIFVWRFVRIIAVALTSLALAKNVADVLWFGHDPVFSEIPAIFGG